MFDKDYDHPKFTVLQKIILIRVETMTGLNNSVQHKLQTFVSMLSKASDHHLRLVATLMQRECRHGLSTLSTTCSLPLST